MGLLNWGNSKPEPKNKRYRVEKCTGCRRPVLACKCNEGKKVRAPRGTPAEQRPHVDQRAHEWCAICGCLVRGGKCANVTCKNH